MAEAPFELSAGHRWFAIESNNAAWDLLSESNRDEDGDEAMIHLAHAALYHWSQVGQPINRLRGYLLLAKAYVETDEVEGALRWADMAIHSLESTPDANAFDRVCALAVAAEALSMAGEEEEAVSLAEDAVEAFTGIDDKEERDVLLKFYGNVLAPEDGDASEE
ncbi:MAG: hypothetical protein KF812_00100 [Fimbriimonadaceae bacterium]|nr:hypothetical protein [Fimbriimonadaceae bacterium]